MKLPTFKYHPDPLGTGSIQPSDRVCDVCGQTRGYIYAGPVHAEKEFVDTFCPWCIANGGAHEKYNAKFVDTAGVGGYGEWPIVPSEVMKEVTHRTPGFSGWQQERWFTHCDDAGEFLGPAGRAELEEFGIEALSAIQKEAGLSAGDWDNYLPCLDKKSGPTAYVFRCRHCGVLGGYSDCH